MKKNTFSYYYNLIRELSWADFKLKYYGSILGLFWSFLKPFLMLLILYVVFNNFLKSGIQDYHIYLLLGITFWNFFADGTKASLQSILSKKNILQKINLSPTAVVISAIIHSFWTFIITLIIFFILFFIFGLNIGWSIILLPYFAILIFFLILGMSFLITPLYMKFKDFEHIWDVFLQMLFWATPIVYSQSNVPETFLRWYMLNPVTRIIVDARDAVIYHSFPDPKQLIITTIIVLIIFVSGLWIFKKYSRQLIENL
ncbi:ABC transporter permease [Patescibacteria group bacterium]|nr:ABC transporter permease [Patescibacteria group bacterium]